MPRFTADGIEMVYPVDASGASVGGRGSSAIFTPAAAAYLAGDIMEGAKSFANIGPAEGGSIIITSAELLVAHTALVAPEAGYRLQLYSVTPPSALADNAAWDLPAGDRASYLGYVDLGSPVDVGSSLYVQTAQINKQIVCATGTLFAYLQTLAAFTPTAAARTVKLHTVGA